MAGISASASHTILTLIISRKQKDRLTDERGPELNNALHSSGSKHRVLTRPVPSTDTTSVHGFEVGVLDTRPHHTKELDFIDGYLCVLGCDEDRQLSRRYLRISSDVGISRHQARRSSPAAQQGKASTEPRKV